MSSDSGETTVVRTIGRYKAFDELGRGAMGVVYRGFDPVIGRTVALKTLIIDTGDAQSKEFRGRLYREAAAAGSLSHPNIVTIFDIIEDGPITAVAMEFIEGRSLAAIIAERAPLPIDLAVEIFDQICSALDYAGSQGIVHRDIKPANILMTPDGRAKITDFGVARLALSTMTQAGTVLGSPSYMSPEQVRGLPLDGRSDLFSAAVVFFEMITRERPFAGNDIATTMYRIAHEPPSPPGRFNAAIGPGVAATLDRSFAKDPAERFQTGAQLVAELRRAAGLGSATGGAWPALSAMAAAPPPPVPPIVMPSYAEPIPMQPTSAMPAPVALPIPVIRNAIPAPSGQSGQMLAPIPDAFAPPGGPPMGGSASGAALPSLPPVLSTTPPVMSPTPTVRPAPGTARGKVLILAGAGGALLLMLAIAGLVFLRGGGSQPAPESATEPVAVAPAAPAAAPPAPPVETAVSTAPPVASVPVTTVPPPLAAGPAGGVQAAGQPSTTPAARPRPVTRPSPPGPPAARTSAAQPGLERPPAGGAPARRVFTSTEVDVRPNVVIQVTPVYPESAARRKVQDVVVLKVLVGPNGRPEDIEVLRGSQKDPALDAAAIAALRQWTFTPAR
jgi:serine/threonine-protein kinase